MAQFDREMHRCPDGTYKVFIDGKLVGEKLTQEEALRKVVEFKEDDK